MSSHGRIVTAVAAVAVVSAVAVFARSTRASADYRAADVNVSCAPSQRAVVRQTVAGATPPQVDVLCVDAAGAMPAGYAMGGVGEFGSVAYAPAIATPAVYYPRTLAPAAPATVSAPRVARTSAEGTTQVRRDARPSWQKRALVIGGSAGAGAGIGALIGGKKGALIGAAIGGGGATILDQVKHQ